MKVIHFIPSIDKSIGGPARSSTQLVLFLAKLSPSDTFELHTLRCSDPIRKDFELTNAKIIFNEKWTSINLNNVDLLHVHGIWSLSIHRLLTKARSNSIPYVISIRGMLEPWSLNQKRLKKKLALWLYQYKDLQNANALHVTSDEECNSVRRLDLKNSIINIPNGIDESEYPEEVDLINKYHSKKILFLSRLHKKKGIEILLKAFCKIATETKKDWTIEIIGTGDKGYLKELKSLSSNLELDSQIAFRGSLYGEEKIHALSNSTLFILPSYSENFGIAIAEALAAHTPVITTHGTPWQDLVEYQAGEWVDLSVDNVLNALTKLMTVDFPTYIYLSKNARKLVLAKYTFSDQSHKMKDAYKWLLGTSSQVPKFIILD